MNSAAETGTGTTEATAGRSSTAETDDIVVVRGLSTGYAGIQILFDVDFSVERGAIVALLGTNGAGKSTLLKAISGLLAPWQGTIDFDGTAIGGLPAHKIARLGVAQMPGGRGVFSGLTVAENIALATWGHSAQHTSTTDEVRLFEPYALFPELERREQEPAGNLSGGQQQMLALEMALLSRPRLLLIDELSLGLAPTIVDRLIDAVQQVCQSGTTVIVVEQSVNVALTLAKTAYFMEKGEIKFHGPTADLLERPELLRSVFLHGASTAAPTVATHPPHGSAVPSAPPHELQPGSARAIDGNDPQPAATPLGAGAPALRVIGVTKRFGGIAALDEVSFDVATHEIVGFIGPNGAGKTTLFDAISGTITPERGRVELNGVDVANLAPHRRAWAGLGRSFQDGRLFPGLSVERTIAVALERHLAVRDPLAEALWLPDALASEDQSREWVDELIERLGLGAHREHVIGELSTGTRRVVDIACALAHRPSVLLLDEPSAGIAQREVEALGPLLLNIRRDLGASLLVIEHDMPMLQSVCDRLIAMDLGAVVTAGAAPDVLSHPDVVHSYLGTGGAAARSDAPSPSPLTPGATP